MASIMAKAEKCMDTDKMRRKAEKIVDDHMLGRSSDAETASRGVPTLAHTAYKFVDTVHRTLDDKAGSEYADGELGPTAISALGNLDVLNGTKVGRGKYIACAYYPHGSLHRDSLEPDRYDGVYDIVRLLNDGYSANGRVFGIWPGHGDKKRYSLMRRSGSHFIEQAIDDFMGNYASECGVTHIRYNGEGD